MCRAHPDFSDGDAADEVFACQFRNVDAANLFRAKFEEFCAAMGVLHGTAPAATAGAVGAGAGGGAGAGAATATAALPAVAETASEGVDRSQVG